jgi:hypothetical protein
MKLDKDEVIVRNANNDQFILNTATKKYRPLPIEKEQITKNADFDFCDTVMRLAKSEYAAGKHPSLGVAIESIVKQYPELYEEYSKTNTKVCRGD